MAETYLGDGAYASFDGYQFILRAPRDNGDHHVALEPPVLLNLLRYARRTYEAHDCADRWQALLKAAEHD